MAAGPSAESGVANPLSTAAVRADDVDFPTDRAAAVALVPTASGGSTSPMLSASKGSSPAVSSQRPTHPDATGVSGDAVCQMSIDRKWLWSGFGYPTPRTMASFFWVHSAAIPVRPGLSPSCPSRCSTSSAV